MHTRRSEWLGAAAVGTVALALYGWTLAPTVTLVDSGELIVAAHSLGVAHPPGFPLYVLLAHLATWVPLGNVAAARQLRLGSCSQRSPLPCSR